MTQAKARARRKLVELDIAPPSRGRRLRTTIALLTLRMSDPKPRHASLVRLQRKLGTFLRSLLTGGFATLVDLAVLSLAIALGAPARVASVPALLAGAIAQFIGSRRFAFKATAGSLRTQAAAFAIAEAVALALNALLFDLVARRFTLTPTTAVLARAITTNLVFMLWSFPVWSRIFRAPRSSSPA